MSKPQTTFTPIESIKAGPWLEAVTWNEQGLVPVIASGGVGNLQHLVDGITKGHADAVLAASIFHYGEYTVGQAKEYMAAQGIPVRI